MKKIKFLKNDYIQLENQTWRPYKICELPPSFGMSEKFELENGKEIITPLIPEWFNYKGYTYIRE